ncbi:40S ribosomal protein S4 isoform X2 [Pyrus x bretschneideri]|uniref:40S ribosomal protein S4 isoform X2 n=1 Tax=Pyrus x bretschneideri TaxID=225117 RepID=UPI00202F0D88|nr:40S ribosomal protein S4 isoform X2 [Pyrus x bretschneideri]
MFSISNGSIWWLSFVLATFAGERFEEAFEEAQCPEALDARQTWRSIYVISIPKTNENFRLLYDTKGRFRLHSIRDEEFKLCKVRSLQFGQKGIPYINTYDGRTIRYPNPLIKANDTIKLDLGTNKITNFIKFDVGNVVMVTGGRNRGRVGVIKNREKHKGSFETIHVQDATGHEFATRLGNVFTIGKGTKPSVSLPKGKGIKLTIIEEAKKRQAALQAATA